MRNVSIGLFFCWLLSIACGAHAAEQATAQSAASAPSFSQILAAKKLRIGTYLAAPYAIKGSDGRLTGSEIDIGERLAQDMGVQAEIKIYEWDKLLPALQRGEIDIIVAGMSVTPQRALQVYFSNPYASSGVSLATNTKLTTGFSSLDSLNKPDVAIGVLPGSISEQVARDIFSRASIKTFADEAQAEEALVKGLLHAFVRSEPGPRFLALRHPKEVDVPISRPLVSTREAFAVRRGDSDFINYLNAWIVAREADAWLTSTRKYWFESLDWQGERAK
jgi:polar amino acid transport system substrate-binding protein